jgi:hypothetical protein
MYISWGGLLFPAMGWAVLLAGVTIATGFIAARMTLIVLLKP